MWFKLLTGFQEESYQHVHKNLHVDGCIMTSAVNRKSYTCGTLETPSLGELRNQLTKLTIPEGHLRVQEVIEDIQTLHKDISNENSIFQVASQFNLLEMISPEVIPEKGIDNYEYDLTQGPACAIAAGAGTIYRNYFVTVNGQIGQTKDNQIDCLHDIGNKLGNIDNRLWSMKNGYALVNETGLKEISDYLKHCNEYDRDELRKLLRVGIQWNTEVTISDAGHLISQVYCSALPVAYSEISQALWEDFALLVLEASYEATIICGIINSANTKNNKIFLTKLGGGAFGNKKDWIISAMNYAFDKYKQFDLNVSIVSHVKPENDLRKLINRYQ